MFHGCQAINSFEGSPTSFTRGPWMMPKTQSIRRIGPWSCEMLRYNCDNETYETNWPKNVRKHKKTSKKFYWERLRKAIKTVPSIGPRCAGHHGLLWSLSSLAGPTTPGGLETILWRGHKTATFLKRPTRYAHLIGIRSLEVRNWELKRISCAPNLKTWKFSNFGGFSPPEGFDQFETHDLGITDRKVETVFGLHYLEKLPLQSVPEPGHGTLDQCHEGVSGGFFSRCC